MSEQRQSRTEPTLRAGQIWLIEQSPELALSAHDHAALTNANVIIYDRALAPLVERLLPIGSYAEPLSHDARTAGSAISPRALEFAAGGWSVVQLVEARCGVRRRLRGAAETLAPLDRAAGLSVQVIARATGHWAHDTHLPELGGLIDECDEDDFLTLVFGPLTPRRTAPALAFTANGLAG
jgi:hypothetical protein